MVQQSYPTELYTEENVRDMTPAEAAAEGPRVVAEIKRTQVVVKANIADANATAVAAVASSATANGLADLLSAGRTCSIPLTLVAKPAVGKVFSIGADTYQFVDGAPPALPGAIPVEIGADADAARANALAALDLGIENVGGIEDGAGVINIHVAASPGGSAIPVLAAPIIAVSDDLAGGDGFGSYTSMAQGLNQDAAAVDLKTGLVDAKVLALYPGRSCTIPLLMANQPAVGKLITIGGDTYEFVDGGAVVVPGAIPIEIGLNADAARANTGAAVGFGAEHVGATVDPPYVFYHLSDTAGGAPSPALAAALAVSDDLGGGDGFGTYTNFSQGLHQDAKVVDAKIAAIPALPVFGLMKLEAATGAGAAGTMVTYGRAYDVGGAANISGQINGKFKIYSVVGGALTDVTSTATVTPDVDSGSVTYSGDWIRFQTQAAGPNSGLFSAVLSGLAGGVDHLIVAECLKIDLTDPYPIGIWHGAPAATVGP